MNHIFPILKASRSICNFVHSEIINPIVCGHRVIGRVIFGPNFLGEMLDTLLCKKKVLLSPNSSWGDIVMQLFLWGWVSQCIYPLCFFLVGVVQTVFSQNHFQTSFIMMSLRGRILLNDERKKHISIHSRNGKSLKYLRDKCFLYLFHHNECIYVL